MNCRTPKGVFGKWIDNRLTESKMREEDLANELGITRITISNHISGKVQPHRSTIEMYANYFDVPWQMLYEMVIYDSK